jgi:hypothetical protein
MLGNTTSVCGVSYVVNCMLVAHCHVVQRAFLVYFGVFLYDVLSACGAKRIAQQASSRV